MKYVNIPTRMRTVIDNFINFLAGSAITIRLSTWISGLKVNQLFEKIHINEYVVTLTAILSLILIVMKIYDQYLETKKRKKEDGIDSII